MILVILFFVLMAACIVIGIVAYHSQYDHEDIALFCAVGFVIFGAVFITTGIIAIAQNVPHSHTILRLNALDF